MRILIVGGDGMLGHRLYLHLSANHDVFATVRRRFSHYEQYEVFDQDRTFPLVELLNYETLESVIDRIRPDAIINCAAITSHRYNRNLTEQMIRINSVLPHQIARTAASVGSRFLQISTDGVFRGDTKHGPYREADPTDATDIYGKSKALGEVSGYANCLTLRLCIVGLELYRKQHLLEWFLAQDHATLYPNAYFSGMTTNAAARAIEVLLIDHPYLSGIFHLAGPNTSKAEMLMLAKEVFETRTVITHDPDVYADRSLSGAALSAATGFRTAHWYEMLTEMRYSSERVA